MNLLFSPYQLKREDNLQIQKGALVKVVENEHWGVADICPHLHLKDQSLEQEIKRKGPLYEYALRLAHDDLEARKNNKTLLSDLPIATNILVTDFEKFDFLNSMYEGVTYKIKGTTDVLALAQKLNQSQIKAKLRLDFNSQLTVSQFDFFLAQLASDVLQKIEYIEDPTPYCAQWKKWNQIIALAYDFESPPAEIKNELVQIVKLSRESVENISPFAKKTIFTSAMEHPVGFAHALRLAQKQASAQNFIQGFSTLNLYEVTDFHTYFKITNHDINFSRLALSETGIGMSDALSNLPWCTLNEIWA